MEKVQTTVSLQVESLVELGDRLYRDEQIGPAVAVWESALELDPDHEEISEKIDRARPRGRGERRRGRRGRRARARGRGRADRPIWLKQVWLTGSA